MPRADSLSGGGNGTFSSFNVGLIHFVMVSSEVYMSVQPHSAGLAFEQAEWLERDLAAVDRAATPFVALGLHQPFYCSPNDDQDDVSLGGAGPRGRRHLPPPLPTPAPPPPPTTTHSAKQCHQIVSLVRVGLEAIIYKGGVDIVFGAHEHSECAKRRAPASVHAHTAGAPR